MKNLKRGPSLAGILLTLIASLAFYNWEWLSNTIMVGLKSSWLTFGFLTFLIVPTVIHFFRFNHSSEDTISNKSVFERPLDYLQFLVTYGAILLSIQAIARELFAYLNFPAEARCLDISVYDGFGFGATLIVLTTYSYAKVKPVFQQTFASERKPVKPEKPS